MTACDVAHDDDAMALSTHRGTFDLIIYDSTLATGQTSEWLIRELPITTSRS